MKRFLMIGVLAAGLGLAGCTAQDAAGLAAQIKQVQDIAKATCGYLPYAQSVAAIFQRASTLEGPLAIATQICAAVTTLPLADGPGGRKPRVHGVIVTGRFIRR